jgi:adenine-specific DNA methylase
MIPKECKRLAEVEFPISIVGRHSLAEKARRMGTPHQLHLWWAWRPLAACRAMLLALLLPDPCDKECPNRFKEAARSILRGISGRVPEGDLALRGTLLDFIADVSDWTASSNNALLHAAHELVRSAHDESPLVVDPFGGGGSIPLEALRLGCDVVTGDLNPVACLILKAKLTDIPHAGREIADRMRDLASTVLHTARATLADLYPIDSDGSRDRSPISGLGPCDASNLVVVASFPLFDHFGCRRNVVRGAH